VPRKHCLTYPYFYNTIKREKELQTKLLGGAREESYQLKREKEETALLKREKELQFGQILMNLKKVEELWP
jgi:hypothetical protein